MKETTTHKTFVMMVLAFLMLVVIAGAPASANSSSQCVIGDYTGYNSAMLPPQNIFWPD